MGFFSVNKFTIGMSLASGALLAACLIAWAIREPNEAVDPAVPSPYSTKQYQLLKFSGSWCFSCRSLASSLKNRDIQRLLAAKKVKQIDIDIDKEPKTAADWEVTTVPVIILVEINKSGRGSTLRRHIGSLSSKDLAVFVDPTKEFTKPE